MISSLGSQQPRNTFGPKNRIAKFDEALRRRRRKGEPQYLLASAARRPDRAIRKHVDAVGRPHAIDPTDCLLDGVRRDRCVLDHRSFDQSDPVAGVASHARSERRIQPCGHGLDDSCRRSTNRRTACFDANKT